MRRLLAGLSLFAVLAFAAPVAEAAEWHTQQPSIGGVPALLGEVGDLECWNGEANRCLLTTAGNGGVAAGLFAYDGNGWYRYSTVCGGENGRIAWAGPSEFWTISKQQAGQGTGANKPPPAISLCHFRGGQVVASYGEPIGVASSYLKMNAAACASPSDCWFAGERLPAGGLNQGAFHLHWDGSSLTRVPPSTSEAAVQGPGRSVFGLAVHQGSFYESASIDFNDVPNAEEVEKEGEGLGPSYLRRIQPDPVGSFMFQPLFGLEPPQLEGAAPTELQGFHLSDEGSRLWAVSGALNTSSSAGVTVLRLESSDPVQLTLEDPAEVLDPGDLVAGAAAEPGAGAAWISFTPAADSGLSPARLARIDAAGLVSPEVVLPAPGETVAGEVLGNKGLAGPLACPAPEQCWMATGKGWLFHLGADPAPNGDPALHTLISFRPPDNSLPVLPPLELPEDDSGANSKKGSSDQEAIPGEFEKLPKRLPPLYSKVKQRLVGQVLELSFTLSQRAHVQLIAKRKGRVVARTRRYTLGKGRHELRLELDPERWPTKLDFKAKAVKGGAK